MASKIILQGLIEENHLDAVEEVLAVPDLQTAILSVAFIRSSGVYHLAPTLKKFAGRTKVFAGVRNGITSAHAIRDLLDLGVKVHLVDTGSVSRVYHPKLYFARGKTQTRVLVGSANLTSGGLNNNIEASVLVELDMSNAADAAIAKSVEETFADMLTSYPENVKKLTASITLDKLLDDPRLMDETVVPRPVGNSSAGTDPNATPLMKTRTKTLRAAPAKKRAAGAKVAVKPVGTVAAPGSTSSSLNYVRMWRTENLKERDLNVPKAAVTHATGSMNLDKGDLQGVYEWSNYFRNKVFHRLDWSAPDARKIQRAKGWFRIVVEGIDCGEVELEVRHDTKTDTTSYDQKNAMTKLSWGPAKPFVARRELIGRTLTLSKAEGFADKFMISID